MAKAFWKGAISFGLVVIPVKMYIATESKTPSFHLLHKKCLTRPKQVLYCEKDDEYFKAEDTVRGYEYTEDEYIVVDESDFRKVPVSTTRTIHIVGFVEEAEVDPIYFYGCHYLEPEEVGAKPFALLRETLIKTKRVGLAKVAFQRREHLCCLRPRRDLLLLHTLHYQDEILPPGIVLPPAEGTPAEMKMAASLVEAMARPFRPEEYQDEYRVALKKMLEAKMKGEEIKVPKAPKAKVGDLMTALKDSIAAAEKETAARKTAGGSSKKSK